jgi:hypothetical protein
MDNMTIKQLISSCFLLIVLNAIGQTKSNFPNLAKVSIDKTYGVLFGYDKSTTRFINKPCYLLDKNDPLHCYIDSVVDTWTFVAKFKNKNLEDSLNITYSQGLSADPEYSITSKTGKKIGRFSCIEFYINSLGTIYTAGHVNNMFNRKRKFQILKDTIIEIQQPFNYVGVKGKTLKDITLYNDKIGNTIIAQIPKNYEIEVLLSEGNTEDYRVDYYYLVKTEFGLIGWLRLSKDDYQGTVIENLYYNGD